MTDNVTNLAEHVPSNSPLAMILRRRQEIADRREVLKQQAAENGQESHALYNENLDLEQAEATVRKLMERGK
jgi:hypothetical protein